MQGKEQPASKCPPKDDFCHYRFTLTNLTICWSKMDFVLKPSDSKGGDGAPTYAMERTTVTPPPAHKGQRQTSTTDVVDVTWIFTFHSELQMNPAPLT